jgi:type IV pilus assembly protein PilM
MARARTSTFVGLNIEPGLAAAAQVSVNGAITVRNGGTAELDPSVLREGEVADAEALSEALRALWREHPELDKRVRIGVANARIVVRMILLPPIEDRQQLATAVRFQAGDEIPMALDANVWDFQAVGVVDTPDGPRQRIVLVAARRDMVDAVLGAARAAGLRPQGIDLSAFGMLRALRPPGTSGAAELYVSVGGLTNVAAVGADGVCGFTRVAGGGLEGLAVELAERRELTLDHARMWLRHTGLERDVAKIDGDAEIVVDARAVLADGVRRIGTEVRASLDFHHGQTDDGPVVDRVVLTGPAVAVPGFATALEAEVGVAVESRVVAGASGSSLDALNAGSLSVAAGLAVADGPIA